MPRYARAAAANVIYHVIHRGNNKQTVFHNDGDYRYFLALMKFSRTRFHVKLYAYALMGNHIHLLVEPQEGGHLAAFMKYIAQTYAQYVNRVYQRSGTLWEGRFKSACVASDRYLLACSRYIEMNPVRARLVLSPEDYPWSSYREKTGLCNGVNESFALDTDAWYVSLGQSIPERQKNYKLWFMNSVLPDEDELKVIRDSVNHGWAFGDARFTKQMEEITGRTFGAKKRGRPVMRI